MEEKNGKLDEEEGIYNFKKGDIGFGSLLARHLDRIGFLSTRVDINSVQSVNNIVNAISVFERMLTHMQDDEYKDARERILKSKKPSLYRSYDILSELTNLMNRKGLGIGSKTKEYDE